MWAKNRILLNLIVAATVSVATANGQLLGQSNIEKVKESVLVLDQTRTLVQALELSDCFTETKWSSFSDDKGRDIVQFEGKFKDFGPFSNRIRPTLGRTMPDKDYTTFTCGPCTYFIQFAMLKSQTAIPGLGIQGPSFTILRSWFEADVAKRADGIAYDPERIRASETGNDIDTLTAGMIGLGGTGLVSPALQQIYIGNFPSLIAVVFTSISAAVNKPYNRDYFSVLTEEQVAQLAREQEEKMERERKQRAKQAEDEEMRNKEESAKKTVNFVSLATPMGRYRNAVNNAIRESWNSYTKDRMDMFSIGEIEVIVTVDTAGKVLNPRVVSNTSNEILEVVTVESLIAAKIPPMPLDVVAAVQNGRMDVGLNFKIVPSQ
jgi:hypothetical protein